VAVAALVLGLLGSAVVAFAMTEALKLERTPITAPRIDKRFSPTCACGTETAALAFTLRRADQIDAMIVDGQGEEIRTLTTAVRRPRGPVRLEWDGRDETGEIVPDGRYQLRIHLSEERRTILLPSPVFVDTDPPRIEILRVEPEVLSPDGDGRSDKLAIFYRTSEPARGNLLADEVSVRRARLRSGAEGRILWGGTAFARPLPAGSYELSFTARDGAGNLGVSTGSTTFRIRYIEIRGGNIIVRGGGRLRFGVDSDARRFSWRLRGLRGRIYMGATARPGRVSFALPRRVRPGRYILEVEANAHRDRVAVRVVRPSL
jgi:hypothetical protein